MSTHTLDTISPEITFRNGQTTTVGKRNVRWFNGTLCVSASGKLWPITVTGPRAATVDKAGACLHDFGSSKAAMGKVEGVPGAQDLAPVATLASLGVDRPAKGEARTSKAAEIAALQAQVAELTQIVAAFTAHKS